VRAAPCEGRSCEGLALFHSADPMRRPRWSPEALAAALTAVGLPVTGRTVRNWIGAGDLPARRDESGAWKIADRDVRARWPSLSLRELLAA
jgi:hypothetical protein